MCSEKSKQAKNKRSVVSRSLSVSYVVASTPQDAELTEKARIAGRKFRYTKSAGKIGRRESKEDFKAASA